MHSEWEELIPFYVAGTLPKNETIRLENHLARCAQCTKAVEEWRAIAGAVRDNAAAQMRALPPLSRGVIQTARRQAAVIDYENVSRLATRRVNTPITLVAAVFTVLLFGGLLALFIARTLHRDSEGVALVPTSSAAATEGTFIDGTLAEGTPSLIPQIIVIEPTDTPVPTKGKASPTLAPTEAPDQLPTAVQPPTLIEPNPTQQIFPTFVLPTSTPTVIPTQPLPPTTMAVTGMGGGGNADTSADALTFSAQSSFSAQAAEACEIRAAVPSAILYTDTNTLSAIVGTIGASDVLAALGMSAGWYNAQSSSGAVGWVQQEMVYVTGSCSDLPILSTGNTAGNAMGAVEPTPIPMLVESPLVTIPTSGINLRGGPGTDYALVGTARSGESYHVEAQYTRQGRVWYRLTVPGAAPAWISASLVQLSPANATIPAADSIPPTPSSN